MKLRKTIAKHACNHSYSGIGKRILGSGTVQAMVVGRSCCKNTTNSKGLRA
jgi:hypothetical protein